MEKCVSYIILTVTLRAARRLKRPPPATGLIIRETTNVDNLIIVNDHPTGLDERSPRGCPNGKTRRRDTEIVFGFPVRR